VCGWQTAQHVGNTGSTQCACQHDACCWLLPAAAAQLVSSLTTSCMPCLLPWQPHQLISIVARTLSKPLHPSPKTLRTTLRLPHALWAASCRWLLCTAAAAVLAHLPQHKQHVAPARHHKVDCLDGEGGADKQPHQQRHHTVGAHDSNNAYLHSAPHSTTGYEEAALRGTLCAGSP
jgi:hypothetical protein